MRFIRFFFFYCFILLMYVCVRLITLDVDFFFYLLETGDEQLQILYYKISYFHLFYLTTVRLDRIYLTHTNLSFTTVNFLLLFYCLKIKSSSRLMVVVRIKF